jgi:CPA2 family monovalent cation:H+ antiporter-2
MEHSGHLSQIVILLAAAVCIVLVFKRLKLSPVLGYLVAGAAIGEHGFGHLHSSSFETFAEFGVVFLLFAIGLELTFERLLAMRSHVFGFGSLQVILTTALFSSIAHYGFGISIESSIVIGAALALSSTAIVLRVLSDTNNHTSQVGRLSLANLLLQDFAVVPLLVLVPLLAKNEGHLFASISTAMLKATITMVLIFIIGRMLLRPIFRLVAQFKSNELFIATTLLLVLGTSFLTLSFGGSLAMGAFIAGLLVAETEYQHQVEEDILPFKDLLMGLFFMTIGMTIHLDLIVNELPTVLALSFGLIILKGVIITLLSRLFRFSWHSALQAGLLLSQGSEFAFILFSLAAQPDIALISQGNAQILLIAVTATMAATPMLAGLGQWISRRIEFRELSAPSDKTTQEIEDLSRHVVIIGFEPSGEMVAKMMAAKKINYVVLEPDSKIVRSAKRNGTPIYKGDPHKISSLRSVGVERAKTVIITLREMVLAKKVIRTIHQYYPDVPIVVRADDLRNYKSLTKIGATIVVPERHEAGLQLAGELLGAMGLSEFEVSQLKNEFRVRNYESVSQAVPPIES